MTNNPMQVFSFNCRSLQSELEITPGDDKRNTDYVHTTVKCNMPHISYILNVKKQ